MTHATRIKPISYFKANAAEVMPGPGRRRRTDDHHPERRSHGRHPGHRHPTSRHRRRSPFSKSLLWRTATVEKGKTIVPAKAMRRFRERAETDKTGRMKRYTVDADRAADHRSRRYCRLHRLARLPRKADDVAQRIERSILLPWHPAQSRTRIRESFWTTATATSGKSTSNPIASSIASSMTTCGHRRPHCRRPTRYADLADQTPAGRLAALAGRPTAIGRTSQHWMCRPHASAVRHARSRPHAGHRRPDRRPDPGRHGRRCDQGRTAARRAFPAAFRRRLGAVDEPQQARPGARPAHRRRHATC